MKKIYVTLLLASAQVHLSHAQTWTAQTSGTNLDLYGISFVDANNGWCAGFTGTILHTTDGGTTWNPQTSNVTVNLRMMFSLDLMHSWAVGDGGTIVATTDGGVTWNTQNSNVTSNLRGVQFIDANTGWVAGLGGVILRTTNGGTTWTTYNSASSSDGYRCLKFMDANNGWVCGSTAPFAGGLIQNSTNGGAAWNAQTLPVTANAYYLDFTDLQNGWTAGEGGAILHTTNGGANWNTQPGGTMNFLRHVNFISTTVGWACGDAGTIIKYSAPTAVEEDESNGYSIRTYPNPFVATILISGMNAGSTIAVFDMTGRMVSSQKANSAADVSLDVADLLPGIYFVRIESDGTIVSKRIIKE